MQIFAENYVSLEDLIRQETKQGIDGLCIDVLRDIDNTFLEGIKMYMTENGLIQAGYFCPRQLLPFLLVDPVYEKKDFENFFATTLPKNFKTGMMLKNMWLDVASSRVVHAEQPAETFRPMFTGIRDKFPTTMIYPTSNLIFFLYEVLLCRL